MTEATEKDDIEIVLDDTPVDHNADAIGKAAADASAPEPKPETKTAAKSDADLGIEDLKAQLAEQRAQLAAERQRAIEAQQAAAAERQRAQQLEGRALNSDMHMVQNAIEAYSQAQQNAKAEYVAAQERGDYAAAADAQERIAANAAKLQDLERGKQAIQRKAEQKPQEPAKPQSADPVEQYIGQFSAKSQEWLRAHREFVTDPTLNNRMIGAHHMALAEGYTAETPEYFAYLEQNTRPSEAKKEAASTAVAAPVSRSAPATTKNGIQMEGNKIRLSAAQREAAAISGVSEKEYALGLLDAVNKGEIGNNR